MRRFVMIAILLITAGVTSIIQPDGGETAGAALSATQEETTLPQILGVLAIAGGVAFLVGSRERTT